MSRKYASKSQACPVCQWRKTTSVVECGKPMELMKAKMGQGFFWDQKGQMGPNKAKTKHHGNKIHVTQDIKPPQ